MVYRNKMKYIYKKNDFYVIVKSLNKKTHNFGYYKKLKDAISKRDWLEKQNWNTKYAHKRDASKPSPDWNSQRKLQQLAKKYQKNMIKHNRAVKIS